MQTDPHIQAQIQIPATLIWVQCIAFVVLYGAWILPEVVGFRNTALVLGALTGLYPIYQYRAYLIQKRSIPIWLIVGLFAWATFHLLFLAQDYPLQALEFKRIWKYTAIGSIFALGLGLSLANSTWSASLKGKKSPFWPMIYFGLCLPALIYLLKYVLSIYGGILGIEASPAFKIALHPSWPYWVGKTDYVAFCLPTLAVSLGQILLLLRLPTRKVSQWIEMGVYFLMTTATLFLFYIQDIKNGLAYAVLCILLFATLLLFGGSSIKLRHKWALVVVIVSALVAVLYPHVQKHDSWGTLIADTKIAFQLDQYPHWKYAGAQGYPNNEYGTVVYSANYERAAWFKAGILLAGQNPLGYGLIEDSFKKMAKIRWPEVSPNLSHSHSGWLDVVLAMGLPGFCCILGALFIALRQSWEALEPWKSLVFWSLLANVLLWITTEVSATVTFAALIFWVSLAGGLTLMGSHQKGNPVQA